MQKFWHNTLKVAFISQKQITSSATDVTVEKAHELACAAALEICLLTLYLPVAPGLQKNKDYKTS